MKRVLLFFVMILLVLVSARSIFCSETPYVLETKQLKKVSDVAKSEYIKLKMESDSLLSKDVDESSLQSIISIIDVELKIVNSLLKNNTGLEVDELLIERDKLVSLATRTVAFMYKTVMNFATSDLLFDSKRSKKALKGKVPLRGKQRSCYLNSIKDILSNYQNEFGKRQYYLSQQTLCLPSDRYNLYVTKDSQKKNLQINIDVKDEMLDIAEKEFIKQEDVPLQKKYVESSDNRNIDRRENNRYIEQRRDDRYSERRSEQSVFRQEPARNRFYQIKSSFEQRADLFSFQSELRNEIDDNVRSFGVKFMTMRDEFIEKMKGHEIVSMIDNVVYLIKDEIRNHVGSKTERDKMFHSGRKEIELNTNIDVTSENSQFSRRSRILFGAITDSATKKTIDLGGWNPDIYELNLRHYLSRFEYFKLDMQRMICMFKDDLKEKFFRDSKRFQSSLDNLMNNLVYSISSTK